MLRLRPCSRRIGLPFSSSSSSTLLRPPPSAAPPSSRQTAFRALSSGGAPPHADLFLAELFGGVVNKPREGTVIQVHQNALARLSGLREARIHDLVTFQTGTGEEAHGLVIDLEQNTVVVAPLDKDGSFPEVGVDVELTGKAPTIPVGDALLGRVVDPLGRPLVHLEPSTTKDKDKAAQAPAAISSTSSLPLLSSSQHRAPGIMARKPLCHRLTTGIKAVDIFHPLGHGQCVAILGQRGSGKTSLALQILSNQNQKTQPPPPSPHTPLPTTTPIHKPTPQIRCIYVAIGQEEQNIKRTVDQLAKSHALESTTIIAAPLEMAPGLRYLAPFAACALAEHWRDQGGHALVIFDDLTRHADAYSQMAKFMSKPEVELGLALHGPLLERFAQMADGKGGGAMTCLALVEGEANEEEDAGGLAHRINSIVDHSINLNLDLARRKVFPALDVTYQMNLQSPGAALLPEPMKGLVQQLRVVLAEAMDDEAGAKLAEQLGIRAVDEVEEGKMERLDYLKKLRLLFQQGKEGRVDDGGLLLCLLCCLKQELLLDLDEETVRQLDNVLSTELPRAKSWAKLKTQVEKLTQHADARTVAEAFWEAHMTGGMKGGRLLGIEFESESIGEETRALFRDVWVVHAQLLQILAKSVELSRKKQQIARLTKTTNNNSGGSGEGLAGTKYTNLVNKRLRK